MTAAMNEASPVRPSQNVLDWLIANRDGVAVGAMVALVIVAILLLARMIGARMVAREVAAGEFGWRSVIGGVLARTGIIFMVMAAIAIVASPNSRTIRRAAAPTPGPARRYPADSTGCTDAGCSAMLIGQRSRG